eukprot:Polyplicarium_translucidae@DN3378_c1_g2_i7.p1
MTDASDGGIGACLLQLQDDYLVPLEFASRKLTDAEKKWSTYERETLAIKFAVDKWHQYVVGRKVTIFTDCASLEFLRKAERGRVHRWLLYLQQYDLTIRHIGGDQNCIADWLSRSVEMTDEEDAEVDEMAPAFVAESVDLQHRLPTKSELLVEYKRCDEKELRDTVSDVDGLHYYIRNHKLFVPPHV